MDITSEMVKELRDRTGISVMQCKAALLEAGGDMEKAILVLSKKGGALAAKKSDRALGAGTVASYIHANKEVGSMVVLRSETDFVSKNEEFIALAREIALQVAAQNPSYVKREDISEQKLADIRDLFAKETEGKPEELKKKILEGKVDAYLKGIVLMEQPYIKDDTKTMRDLIENAGQKFGERIEVEKFIRYSAK
ncbi:MAG: elongation factor Ts [Patescibacteria group bacterium]|nr:elongation factor Ts [Patescibacteria group bacterium]